MDEITACFTNASFALACRADGWLDTYSLAARLASAFALAGPAGLGPADGAAPAGVAAVAATSAVAVPNNRIRLNETPFRARPGCQA